MSTFKGVLEGFEDIRVDYFRSVPPRPPPLKTFLSHVHSDHLQGLENFRACFIYCSPATREILLRLERKKDWKMFEDKHIESRKLQYKHLKDLLKPIPLETPTMIELKHGVNLQVTLFDANHCTGAVMFLFELDGKAVLYTGDVRSEPWFVDSLVRNPLLIEYTAGIKTLDCVYLDTSNTGPHRFPAKGDGLKELLQKVSKYPPNTVFHFHAWTFGYEEVFMALAKALNSPIHVDKYKYRIYQSLRTDFADKDLPPNLFEKTLPPIKFPTHEGIAFTGSTCGNTFQPGIMTLESDGRLHSCEKGTKCPKLDKDTVWIRPIVTRLFDGTELAEPALEDGGNAVYPQIEFDENMSVDELMNLFVGVSALVRKDVRHLLVKALESPTRALSLKHIDLDDIDDNPSLPQLASAIIRSVTVSQRVDLTQDGEERERQDLPKEIRFPYARHSSYEELCNLVSIFKPKDVYPCTENKVRWTQDGRTIRDLFGDKCSGNSFRYDTELDEIEAEQVRIPQEPQSQTTASSQSSREGSGASQASHTRETSLFDLLRGRREEIRDTQPLDEIAKDGSTSSRTVETPDIAPALPSRPEAGQKTLKRNAEGKLRLYSVYDIEDDEVIPVPQVGIKAMPAQGRPVSVLQEVQHVAVQAVEKAVESVFHSDSVKRPRLSLDGPDSSPTDADQDRQDTLSETSDDKRNYIGDWQHTVDEDSDGLFDKRHDTLDSFVTSRLTVFDSVDDVFRCVLCGHEVLGGKEGFCTGCDRGPSGVAFLEDVEEVEDRWPSLPEVYDKYTEDPIEDSKTVKEMVGECLDYDSSAYDSQDSGGNLEEEYEVNSFVDDDHEPPTDSDDDSPNDEETDWEARYKELERKFGRMADAYEDIVDDHLDLGGDVPDLNIDTPSESESVDEDDLMLIIDAVAPEPLAADIVLSEDSQSSSSPEMSPDRLRDRQDAFIAARNGGWHDISLASVSNNHTTAEVEL